MTTIAHPDGRPWRYWPRVAGGMWIMAPCPDGQRPVGWVEPRSSGWRAEAWDHSDSYRSAHGPHAAASALYDAVVPDLPGLVDVGTRLPAGPVFHPDQEPF